MSTKILSQNSEKDCTCSPPCGKIHSHNVTCGVCNGRKRVGKGRIKWRECKECKGVGVLCTCCCGAKVWLHPSAYSCAIATATLGDSSDAKLDLLREYRRQVLEASVLGTILSEHYNRIKDRVAEFIKSRTTLRTTFFHAFVSPGIWLARRRLRDGNKLCGVIVFLLVVVMLGWASVLYIFASFSPKTT